MNHRKLLLALSLFSLTQNSVFAQQRTPVGKAVDDLNPKAPVTFVIPGAKDLTMVTLDPGWSEAQRADRGNGGTIAYTPKGNNPNYQSILVSSYFGFPKTIRPIDLALETKKRQMAQGKASVEWKFIDDKNPNDVIFEYTIKNVPGFVNQYEIQRITSGKDGLYGFVYHTRQVPCDAQIRSHMLAVVKNMSVKDAKDFKATK